MSGNSRVKSDLVIQISMAGSSQPNMAGQPPLSLLQMVTLVDADKKVISQTQATEPMIADDFTDERLAAFNEVLAHVGLVATRSI